MTVQRVKYLCKVEKLAWSVSMNKLFIGFCVPDMQKLVR
jgi:hypothetical protein